MAEVIHIRCDYCGEPLIDRTRSYCPPCNLYLCYRAMPILLGMLLPVSLTSQRLDTLQAARSDPPHSFSYDEEPCIMVDYKPKKAQQTHVAAYEEELCIMVPY